MQKFDKRLFIAEVKDNVKNFTARTLRRLTNSRSSRQCPMR